MKADTPLDYAVFQLTPTRTRCELLVSAGGVTEKLASGLLKPFQAHLRAAEEQIAQGGYSIKLDPKAAGVSNGAAPWFSKGTMERFVRFVSTPEVLERVSTVETELMQLEEAMSMQSTDSARVDDSGRNAPPTPPPAAKQSYGLGMDKNATSLKQLRRESVDGPDVGESSKRRLLRAMDARRLMLQKEQGMAFARASAAGFDMDHMNDLMIFAESFGAIRLREACLKFMALCKKRQEAGLWIEELDLTAAEAASVRSEALGGPEKQEMWSDLHSESGEYKLDAGYDDANRTQGNHYGEGRGYYVEDFTHNDPHRRVGQHYGEGNGELSSSYRPRGKPHQYGMVNQRQTDDPGSYVHDGSGRFSDDGLMGPRPSLWQQSSAVPPAIQFQPPSLGKFAGPRGLPVEGAYPEHAAGDYRDADPGRSTRPRATWSTQSPRQVPNFPHMGDGDMYDSRARYDMGYNGGSQAGRGVPPPLGSHVHQGFPDNHLQQERQLEQQHLQPSNQLHWQMGQIYPDGYDLRGSPHAPPQAYGDSEPTSEIDHAGGAPAPPREWQVSTPTKVQHPSAVFQNNGIHTGPTSQDSPSKHMQSPTDMNTSRRLARRSTSPKRRSPSPMRRVQIGRNGQRRPGMVVIRNINYITSNPQEREKDKGNAKGSGDDDDEESELETDSGEEPLSRKAEGVRMSVQDAISLFEGKKREGSKKKSGKKDSRRGSVESASSVLSHKGSFKRWSGASELSSDSLAQSQLEHELDDEADQNTGDSHASFDKQKHNLGDEMAFMSGMAGNSSDLSGAKVSSSSANYGDDHSAWQADQFEAELNSRQDRGNKSTMEDSFMFPDREVRNRNTRDLPSHTFEESHDPSKPYPSEELMMVPERQRVEAPKQRLLSDDVAEAQGSLTGRGPIADDSFMLGERSEPTKSAFAPSSRMLNPDMDLKDDRKDELKYRVDDSFMVSARQEQTSSTWRMAVNMESELPTNQYSSTDVPAKDDTRSYEPEDVFMLPERNVSRDSFGRAWNAAIDYDVELLRDGQQGEDEEARSVGGDGLSPKSQKGRFYEQYREKRDAKLREESGPKRAEREAKLKAMQEVLERRKAEMTARTGRTADRSNSLAEAQARAEKLRAYKAGLARSKKEKEEEEKKRLEELRAQRRERIAARSSPTSVGTQSAASTPRASARQPQPPTPKPNIVRKLSPTPQKATTSASTPRSAARGVATSSPRPLPKNSPSSRRTTGGGQSGNGENPLSRSVPSLAELRKENTKPSGGRTGTNSLQDSKSVLPATKATGPGGRAKPSSEAALVEANGGVPAASRASRVGADDRRKSVTGRKSLSGATEPRVHSAPAQEKSVLGPLKVSRDLLPEPTVASRVTRRTAAPAHDAKPFLRKGTGIGPGAGPGVRKLKDALAEAQKVQEEDDVASNADTASVADAPSTPALRVHVSDAEAMFADSYPEAEAQSVTVADEEGLERAGVGPGLTAIRAPTSTAPGAVSSDSSLETQATGAGRQDAVVQEVSGREDVKELVVQASAEGLAIPFVAPTTKSISPPRIQTNFPVRVAEPSSPYKSSSAPSVRQPETYEAPHAELTRSPMHPSLSVSIQGRDPEPTFSTHVPAPPAAPPVPVAPSTPLPVKKTLLEALISSESYVAPLAPASASPSRGEVYARASDAGDHDGSYAAMSGSPSHVRSPHFLAAVEQYSAPIALASASPAASPASHTLPQLRHTVSPNLEAVKAAAPAPKKLAAAQKAAPVSQQAPPKEAQKSGGLKRLLKFGRKSTGSSTSSISNTKSDWVSASTTSEGDDEADDATYGESKPQGNGSKSRAPTNTKNSKNVAYGMDFSSDGIHEDSFNDHSSSSVRSSIPHPPANFKLREDHLAGGSMLKAPRSFFSLSSFRSKGSEGKYRA